MLAASTIGSEITYIEGGLPQGRLLFFLAPFGGSSAMRERVPVPPESDNWPAASPEVSRSVALWRNSDKDVDEFGRKESSSLPARVDR